MDLALSKRDLLLGCTSDCEFRPSTFYGLGFRLNVHKASYSDAKEATVSCSVLRIYHTHHWVVFSKYFECAESHENYLCTAAQPLLNCRIFPMVLLSQAQRRKRSILNFALAWYLFSRLSVIATGSAPLRLPGFNLFRLCPYGTIGNREGLMAVYYAFCLVSSISGHPSATVPFHRALRLLSARFPNYSEECLRSVLISRALRLKDSAVPTL